MVANALVNWRWNDELKRGLDAREARRYTDLLKVRAEIDGVWLDCELACVKIPRTLPTLGVSKGWHLALILPRSMTLVPANGWCGHSTEEEALKEAMRLWGLRPKPIMSRDYRITWPTNMAVSVRGGAR